jgi:hypothetical protein
LTPKKAKEKEARNQKNCTMDSTSLKQIPKIDKKESTLQFG